MPATHRTVEYIGNGSNEKWNQKSAIHRDNLLISLEEQINILPDIVI